MYVAKKTSYDHDMRLFEHAGVVFWYALLGAAAIAAPLLLDTYYLSQLTFVCIYAVAGVGLMLLSGYAGQISLGHAAFLAAGAYAEAILQANGVPLAVSLPAAALIAAVLGLVAGIPALRLGGIYLAVATLALAFIVEEVLVRWESLTKGNFGITLAAPSAGGFVFDVEWKMYCLALGVLTVVMFGAANLLRSHTGRALTAIRDSEIAAQSLGVHLAWHKTLVFAISAGLTGLAGGLYAHKIGFISPDQFTVTMSIELLVMILVGGLGSLHGAVLGAAFIVLLPQVIVMVRGVLPISASTQGGLDAGLFGLLLILFMLYEPQGLYGRWVKVRMFLELFPFYRKATFRRQRGYVKTDRLR